MLFIRDNYPNLSLTVTILVSGVTERVGMLVKEEGEEPMVWTCVLDGQSDTIKEKIATVFEILVILND